MNPSPLDTVEPMTRGGRTKPRKDEPERRCIVTRETAPVTGLVRFVLGPDATLVPDVLEKLPGRGVWVTADRSVLEQAVAKRAFSRVLRTQVTVPEDLADLLEKRLADRVIESVSMARRAGAAVTGQEKVRARIQGGGVAVLLQASDAAPDGVRKVARLAEAVGEGEIEQVRVLNQQELGLAFGREFAIHAALDAGGLAQRVTRAAARLAGFRPHAGSADTEPTDAHRGDARATGTRRDEMGPTDGPRE